jgi:hypothetical protein
MASNRKERLVLLREEVERIVGNSFDRVELAVLRALEDDPDVRDRLRDVVREEKAVALGAVQRSIS